MLQLKCIGKDFIQKCIVLLLAQYQTIRPFTDGQVTKERTEVIENFNEKNFMASSQDERVKLTCEN